MIRPNRTKFNHNWHFRFETDSDSQPVTLPHSWNALDTMSTVPDGFYRRGVAVYECDFERTEDADQMHWWLEFEAVAQRTKVYDDENRLLAEHHGGYTPFRVRIPEDAIALRVEADNIPDIDLIPSELSDFFLYGGITRNVWRYWTGPAWVESMRCEVEAGEDAGKITVHLKFGGAVDDIEQLSINVQGVGFSASSHLDIDSGIKKEMTIELPPITGEAYRRWSPDAPNLYEVSALIVGDWDMPDAYDHVTTKVGFRTFDFPEGGPFVLNGERLLLRGTHRHEDWAGYGGAVPDDITRHEFQLIKDAGFNFVRLGHYPQSHAALDACDELGLIVWEELPWCRGGVGGRQFKHHARTMLREMIEHHHTHPSILFWGMGNELDWQSEHPDTTHDDVLNFLRELHDLTHELDPSRLTALRRDDDAAGIIDVYSPSIWSGWYRGRYEEYEAVLTQAMGRFPRLLHTEWGGDSHVGRHNDGPHIHVEPPLELDHAEIPGTATSSEGFTRYSKDGDWSESYILDLMLHHLTVQARLPNLAGTAQWVFKDFGTPLRPENPIPYVNQKGLIARDGTPKDVYYLFKAFQTDEPVVRIESSGWPLRVGADGAPQTFRVITNCERVKLLVDGQSQGLKLCDTQDAPAGILVWHVPLHEGERTIKAIGYNGEDRCARHEIMQTFKVGDLAPVAGVEVTHQADGDTVIVTAQLVDEAGRPVTTDERRVTFIVASGGALLKHQGVMGGSDVIQTANGRAWAMLQPVRAMRVTVQVDGIAPVQVDVPY